MDKELLAANFRDILHTGTVNIAPSPTEFKSQVGNIRQCVQDAVSNAVRDVRGEQSVCKQQVYPLVLMLKTIRVLYAHSARNQCNRVLELHIHPHVTFNADATAHTSGRSGVGVRHSIHYG